MAWLAERGLRGVSMETLMAAMRAGRARGLAGLTFDDGYLSVLEDALPVLLRHDFTATMFIISDRIGATNEWDAGTGPVWPLMTAGQVAQVAAAGMEIGSHTATHPRLPGIGADQLDGGSAGAGRGCASCSTCRSPASPTRTADGARRPGMRCAAPATATPAPSKPRSACSVT